MSGSPRTRVTDPVPVEPLLLDWDPKVDPHPRIAPPPPQGHQELIALEVRDRRARGVGFGLAQQGIHILRHTFCSHLSMRGAPVAAIQELAGHANLWTTQRYMYLSPAAIESAIKLLDQPVSDLVRGDIGETGQVTW